MFDARAFIDRLEVADTRELAEMVRRPSLDEEDALRAYLGDRPYQRLHSLALKLSLQDTTAGKRGNVVVIPGLMGSVLSSESSSEPAEQLWPRFLAIRAGKLDRLMLAGDGRTEANPQYRVRPTGVTKRLYGELLLSLSFNWYVHAFAYDWRKDLDLAADELAAAISGWFGDEAPVHIVAHSVGGLVARSYLQRYAARRAQQAQGGAPGRLIMLGTPNYGSFTFVQTFIGIGPAIQVLDALDSHHDIHFLCNLVSSFPGLYQMLPAPTTPTFTQGQRDFARRFYDPDTYRLYGLPDQPCGELDVSRQHLKNAADHHRELALQAANAADLATMVYISGDGRPTVEWMGDPDATEPCDYFKKQPQLALHGDGIVPHTLGTLRADGGKSAILTYYVNESHSDLASNPDVLAALDDLLIHGQSADLDLTPAPVGDMPPTDGASATELATRQRADESTLHLILSRARAWGELEGAAGHISSEERQAEEILTRSVLNYRDPNEEDRGPEVPFSPSQISVRLIHGGIESLPADDPSGTPPAIDAIAVGHYVGVFPTAHSPEGILDLAISQALMGDRAKDGPPALQDRLLWKFVERGTIQGELGQLFLLPDARVPDRVIAVVGMGVPGRFGVPELTVMARELCWALGRLGRRHLATVFIGAGANNLSPEDAVNGWIRGIKYAVSGTPEDETRRLDCVTFIEHDADQIKRFDAAIQSEVKRLTQEKRLIIDYAYVPPTPDSRQAFSPRPIPADDDGDDAAETESPMRVTVTTDRNAYHFGAVTKVAAIPEREIPLDPKLVSDANDQLVAETHLQDQVDRGQFMARLLLPRDLWGQFFTSVPLVMMLDATTARIHWEMIAQPDRLPVADDEVEQSPDDLHPFFLGTSRGFTRQLRTGFAPPPDPPVSQQRLLRVLVVADPAADAHLPGAEEEGVEVADLFESFNRLTKSQNRVEVVRLFGPREASRLSVLHHLINRSYDVLHYAGHCAYDPDNPALSGWVFTGGERISATEMQRIDRIPGFVFSNACESGITPDRSEMRSAALAPSFAESFFERGVSNFVCTAWPVYDSAARQFALTLYAYLLGIPLPASDVTLDNPQPMYRAMQAARKAIFTPEGARTWGAYQHYGNPYFRFFHPSTES